MQRVEASATIEASPEEVCGILASDQMGCWYNVEARPTVRPASEGPLDPGTRYTVTQSFRFAQVAMEVEILEYAPPERYRSRA